MNNTTQEIKKISSKNSKMILVFLGFTLILTVMIGVLSSIPALVSIQRYNTFLALFAQYFIALPLTVVVMNFKQKKGWVISLDLFSLSPRQVKRMLQNGS